jgi:hypothetical protein
MGVDSFDKWDLGENLWGEHCISRGGYGTRPGVCLSGLENCGPGGVRRGGSGGLLVG